MSNKIYIYTQKTYTYKIATDTIDGYDISVCFILAGVVRFELTHDRVRADCLTAWRHPNLKLIIPLKYIISTPNYK